MWQKFKRYLETHEDLRPNTRRHYTTDVRVCEAGKGLVNGETGAVFILEGKAQATRCRRYNSIRRYLDWALEYGHLTKEAAKLNMKKPPKRPPSKWRGIPDLAYSQLLDTVIESEALSEQDKAYFLVLACTGRRASEILSIQREDVQITPEGIRLFIRPKGSQEHCDETWVYQEDQEAFKRLHGHLSTVSEGLLFDYLGGYDSVRYLWTRYVTGKYTLHQLRHTAISATANAEGAGVEIAQIQAGHKHIGSTMRYVKIQSQRYHSAMRNIKKS